jgi:hypothetical protein
MRAYARARVIGAGCEQDANLAASAARWAVLVAAHHPMGKHGHRTVDSESELAGAYMSDRDGAARVGRQPASQLPLREPQGAS